jgi:hypothetical protein
MGGLADIRRKKTEDFDLGFGISDSRNPVDYIKSEARI